MLDAEVEIVPRGARKSAAQLVVEPNLIVALKRFLHCRQQHVAAVLLRHPSLDGDAHDLFGKPFDDLDHGLALQSTTAGGLVVRT